MADSDRTTDLAPAAVEKQRQPRRSRLRRWGRRLLFAAIGLAILSGAAVLGTRMVYRIGGERELARQLAALDRDDPGWRLADIEAARKQAAPPDEQNSACVVERVLKLIPESWQRFSNRPNAYDLTFPPDNHRLPPDQLLTGPHAEDLGDLVAATEQARLLARTLHTMSHGYRELMYPDFPIAVDLNITQHTRAVFAILSDDAFHAACAGDSANGLRAAHAAINAGRSVESEPLIISQLVRITGGTLAVSAAVRVLALTDPREDTPELARIQAAFLAEAEELVYRIGIRGERAMTDLTFENIENGKFRRYLATHPDHALRNGDTGRSDGWWPIAFVPGARAKSVELITRALAAEASAFRQLAVGQELEAELKTLGTGFLAETRYRLTWLLVPAVDKFARGCLRYQALLRTAAAALACERFRLTKGRWPASLEEIPTTVLFAVPPDPYNGQPIRLHRLPDGIAVVSIGIKQDPGSVQMRQIGPLGGDDIGCRLYDPAVRGLPPKPTAKKADADLPQ